MRKTDKKMTAIYQTARLYVRTLNMEDINGNYSKWFNDQEVCRYNSHGVFPKSRIELEAYIRSISERKDKIVWAILDKRKDCHLGNISLQEIDWLNRTAELAIIIGEKQYWHKGYGLEAAKLLLRHGFEKINLRRIYCGTAAPNIGMQKIALTLGMKKEGVRRKALYIQGKYVDLLEYGILKDEFKKNS